MSLPETCPFCGAGSDMRNGEKWISFTCLTTIHARYDARRLQSVACAVLERTRLIARVAELEELVRQAEASSVNALASLAASEAKIGSRHLENEAVRRQLWRAENACDAMEKRVAELEARCKRLEEAGDRLYAFTPPSSDRFAAWRKAREAKP